MTRPPLSRRSFLTLSGAGLAALGLAACSVPPGPNIAETAAVAPVDPDFIKKNFAGPGGATVGAGLPITVGATLLLSTFQAYYGQLSLRGMELAAEQIAAAGGPQFTFVPKDVAASTTAGADAVRDFASRGIGMVLAANVFNVGSMVGPLAQFKILGIDPGGGTSTLFQKLPFVWGARALAPNDTFPIGLQYMTAALPEARKITLLNTNSGDFSAALEADFRNAVSKFGPKGAEVSTVVYIATNAGGDFTAALTEARRIKPDVFFTPLYGSDPPAFMKKFATSGLKATVIGSDYASSTAEIAGSAMNGYVFAADYFDSNPRNDWGTYFVSTYYAKHKEIPDYFPANYYESTFLLWELVKRVIKKGGDPQDGEQLQNALLDDPTFSSVYGTGSPAGRLEFDPVTHTLATRPMGIFEVRDTVPKLLASGDIGGRDFSLSKP
ncbi:ABC transporter substrate-binding protein [Pseudonocardia sp. CA-142604]|uniref:ABC transporter substrate-binding protein n=1 Tax=Pseudonocardia sp. CA-142604 TaxID=3240024 RepID=UPI003D915787